MSKWKSMRKMSAKVFSCFMSVVLVMGISTPGALLAYADDSQPDTAAPQSSASNAQAADAADADASDLVAATPDFAKSTDEVASQEGEQNYAVYSVEGDIDTLTFYYGTPPAGEAGTDYYVGYDTANYTSASQRPWSPEAYKLDKIVFDDSLVIPAEGDKPAGSHLAPASTAHWFEGCYWVSEVRGLDRLDTSNVTSMERMFYSFAYQQQTLKTLDLSNFDTRKVTNMKEMFFQCSAFANITLGEEFDTSKVTDMSGMFRACTDLASLDFTEAFDTGYVTTMKEMFSGCSNLTSLDVSKFGTGSVTDMSFMFLNCSKLASIKFKQDGEAQTFDTSRVTTMEAMFVNCRALQTLSFPNTFDTSNVTNMKRMFQSCKALTDPGVSAFNTGKVETFYQMFEHCESLQTLDLSNFSSAKAEKLDYMLYGCKSLSNLTFGNGFTAASATSMHSMFENCTSMASVNLSKWIPLLLNDMGSAFYGCTALTSLDLSSWTTPMLRYMNSTFYGCTKLATLDFSGINTSRVTTFYHIFDGCNALNSVKFGENFNGKALAASSRDEYWCMLPTPPTTGGNNGLWWKDGGMSYTPEGICDLTGEDVAGTWTWSSGVVVTLTSTEGGTVTVENASGTVTNTGNEGAVLTLAATPEARHVFTSWTLTSGDDTGTLADTTAATTTFTLGSKNGAVTATFAEDGRTYDYTFGTFSQVEFAYNGEKQVPAFTVRDATSGAVLTEGLDYTVSYEKDGSPAPSPTVAGEYTVYVTGAANYKDVAERPAGTFTILPSFTVSGTLSCASGWTPANANYGSWGSLRVMRPVTGSDGECELVETQWPAAKTGGSANNAFSLSRVTPGSKIIFTPQTPSACGEISYTVPNNQTEAISGVNLVAPYVNGIVEFSSLDFVAADRLYDPTTGADYSKDNDEAARTTPFALDKNNTRVTATDDSGNSVPVYVVNGNSLLIQDKEAELHAGKHYTLTLSVCDPVFRPSYGTFDIYDTYAATKTVGITLGSIPEDAGTRVGAMVDGVKVTSRGRAVIHCANPGKARVLLFLYDAQGNLAGSKKMSGNEGTQVKLPLLDGVPFNYASNETAISLPFMEAGNYTICAVEQDAYGAATKKSNPEGDTSAAPETLAKLRGLGLTSSQLAQQTFAVAENTLTDVGVTSPFSFPTPSTSNVVDFAKSSVTMTNSYSRFATITVSATLQDGVDASALAAGKHPTLRIYTNQKQDLSDADGAEPVMWPQSLSVNGKPVHLDAEYAKNRGWKMLDGWLYLDLADANLNPGYQGADSFPLTVSLTVPRSDYSRSYACAYLQLSNGSNFIGSCDEAAQDITLVAPKVTAEKSFTAQGYTAAKADVALYLDGVPAATVKSDAYGYYAAKLTLPENVDDPTIFDVQATATWKSESKEYSASSEVLDVTYSTTKPSLKRLWMLIQTGQRGQWDYMLVYDNGEWTSMYKSYLMIASTTPGTRRYVWISEFNNAKYAKNVQCVIPRSDGDTIVPTTQDYDQADAWLSLSNPGAKWYTNTELDVQSGADSVDLASLDVRGKLDYRDAAALFTSSLESGNAFVSEPAGLSYPPSGVYVTFDEIERQTLAQPEAYAAPAAADTQQLITTVNQGNYMRIVEQGLDADGKMMPVNAVTAAAMRTGANADNYTEWLALAGNGTTKSDALDYEHWMHLKHSVATTAVDMSEPLGMIAQAQLKYEEFKANIRAAVEAGQSANDAVTICPCKTDLNFPDAGGVPIVDMTVAGNDDLDSMRYFIWAEDSNHNSYVRTMEMYAVAGSAAVVFRQYEADEGKLVITEWNGGTGKKTVITYEIADTFTDSVPGFKANTDFESLMNQWANVGIRVQQGMSEAAGTLAGVEGQEVSGQEGALETQEANLQAAEEPSLATQQIVARNWLDWRQDTLEASGLVTDWGNLKDSELKSLFKFIGDNKSGCLEVECKIQRSNSDSFADPYGAAKAEAFRGGLKRVYDIADLAFSFGQKFNAEGVAGAVKNAAEGYFKTKSQEAYANFIWGQKQLSFEDSVLSKYSDEYKRIVQQLFDFQDRMYENGNPNGIPANCIDWSAIPDDLYYTIKYMKQQRGKDYAKDLYSNRQQGVGSLWPKGKHDPSGIVYEGMLSNPVEGATVQLYEYDQAAGAVIVDSELFGYEPNPQVTGEDGRYQWFVNEGYWQVRVSKDGYDAVSTGSTELVDPNASASEANPERGSLYGIGATKTLKFGEDTINATTWWMPVLPEQIDVNIPLWSTAAPVVESVEGTANGVLVTFSKPMKVDTVTAGMFSVALGDADAQEPAGIEPVGKDVAADSSKDANGNPQELARTFLVKYPSGQTPEIGVGQSATVAFANVDGDGAAQSYAGTAATNGSKTSEFTVVNELEAQVTGGKFTYDGTAHEPSTVVADANDAAKALAAGTDYELSYEKDGASVQSPVDAGIYTVYVTGKGAYEQMGKVDFGTFTIAPREVTVKAADQTVLVNQAIDSGASKVTLSGLASGHSLKSTVLQADTSEVTASGAIYPSMTKIQNAAGEDVTANYSLTNVNGKLVVKDHYTVRYNLNGGSGIAAAQDTDATGKVTLNSGASLSRMGYKFTKWNTLANGRGTAYGAGSTVTLFGDVTLYAQWSNTSQQMHRLYNPYSGEHFYTASDKEKNGLVAVGWNYEGIGWKAPTSGADVYRLYNKWTGDHHFTTSSPERDTCIAAGWTYEGVGWKSGGTNPVFREYNPYAPAFYHNYTASASEHKGLINVGWKDEGIGWYGI